MSQRVRWTATLLWRNTRRDAGVAWAFAAALAWMAALAGLAASPRTARAQDRPITGKAVPQYAALDKIVQEYMDTTGARAAALAVVDNGRPVYARGYGWSDDRQTQATQAGAVFRLGSLAKPITAAIVRALIAERRLSLETPVIAYLGWTPYNGRWGDERLSAITVEHLLEHRGGWDREATFDPAFTPERIEQALRIRPLTKQRVVQYMLAQPLQFAPGQRRSYSNFGYLLLSCVIEKATGKPYAEALRSTICRPLGVSDLAVSPNDATRRHAREVQYAKECDFDCDVWDGVGGLAASAPSLCAFLQRHWMNGTIRRRGETYWYYHTGSLPNSTLTLMEQRRDGVDFVVLFNARRNDRYSQDLDQLRAAVNAALDKIRAGRR